MDNGASSYHRFLEGDESGFDEILDLYQHNLIFFINRYVNNLTVAEDLAEDTFLELLIHKNRYNFQTSLKTYLFAIGRHKALDYIRHNSRFPTISLDEAAEKSNEFISVEAKLLSDERKRLVNAAINRLNSDYRAAIHLVYFEELSYEDAAKVMKKSKKQVENLIYRAKASLRSLLGKEGFEL
ncbi:MAG: hypothetical protein A2Y17_04000 [Clostridiales bacterium GWF2_38_85]|nr:MAG: hypothetical protein A2Y17_04000 [Clostridiales bacterium GWF2_38_85]HBL83961.1 RNA polymerase subunit sigma-24 [Clostridiales bacterium]